MLEKIFKYPLCQSLELWPNLVPIFIGIASDLFIFTKTFFMKKSTLLFLLFTVLFSAQNQRFTYEYKLVKDSTEKSKVTTEIMDLDITAKGSIFYSANKKIEDSLLEELYAQDTEIINYDGIIWAKVNEMVEKIYPNYEIFLFQNLAEDFYKVRENRKMDWKIEPQTEKIGNWETQKATLKIFDRNWTAWFSTSLPFQDGPYKFHGLPGLIVKISDDAQSHIFELKVVKNLPKNYDWKSAAEKKNFRQPISLNQVRFNKVYKNYRKDPIASTRQMMSKDGNGRYWTDEKGNILDPNKQMKDQEESMLEGFKKNNNLLELDLLK